MIKPSGSIQEVKRMVKACARKRVSVRVNLGRNKSTRFCGVLTGVYPSLFTVTPDDKAYLGKTAYSYADVLCGTVKIQPLCAGNE